MKINVGCGRQRPEGWVNCDSSLASLARSIPFFGKRLSGYEDPAKYMDLRRRWPFADACSDVVYGSHIFEHLSIPQSKHFLQEAWRTLKAGGTLRIVVPDLQQLAQAYLNDLTTKGASAGQEFLYHLDLHREQAYPESMSWWKRSIAFFQGYPHQHKYMYDHEILRQRLFEQGFVDIMDCTYAKSRYIPEIAEVENTKEGCASIYLEAKKPR